MKDFVKYGLANWRWWIVLIYVIFFGLPVAALIISLHFLAMIGSYCGMLGDWINNGPMADLSKKINYWMLGK